MADNVTRIRSTDTTARIAVLEHQMDSLNTNIESLKTKVEGQYETLHSRISDMRDDMHREIGAKHEALIQKMDEQNANSSAQHKAIAEKVSGFEKWRWMIMGGALVAGYVLAHMKLEKLF